jgi:DNA-binding MarR family transcriptional regulator
MTMDEKKAMPMENPDIGFLITNISYGIRQYFDKLFVDYDVTYPQSRVLTRLFGQLNKGNVNQRDLEYALGIKASSVSSLVRNLEQKGFIRCERLPQDTRNKQVMLTEKGMELQHVLGSARDKAEEELVKGLDEGQQVLLKQCLRQVLSNLEAET